MNTFFWLWLLDHPQHQAQYLYNYESSLDKERIAELKSKNAALEDDIRKLEQNKTPKDLKNTKFADVDPDLMWTAEKVAVTEAVQPEEHRVSENVESGSSTLIWGILAVAAFIVSFILLFVIDWGGNE